MARPFQKSRTVHANTFMTRKKPEIINRVTSYITMLPKELRSDEVKQERLRDATLQVL